MIAEPPNSASQAVKTPPKKSLTTGNSPKIDQPDPAKSAAVVKSSNQQSLLTGDSLKLEKLAEEIRASHHSIGLLTKSAREKVAETLAEVVLCGKKLSECKAIIGHGGWLKWLNQNCAVSADRAQIYIRVAAADWSNTARARYLEEPKSIRQALALLTDGKKTSTPEKAASAPGAASAADPIRQIAALSKTMARLLRNLPRERQNSALEALEELREWIDSASLPV